MIRAQICEDLFFAGSLPTGTARPWCPDGLRPAWRLGYEWLFVAITRLCHVKLFGVPVAGESICAAVLLLVEYSDGQGHACVGNYFLEGFTDSLPLATLDDGLGLGVFRYMRLRLERHAGRIEVGIGGKLSGTVDLYESETRRPACSSSEELFRGDRSGIVQRRGRLWYLNLLKSHWCMRARPVKMVEASIFNDRGARFEGCFDTSDSLAQWGAPRRVGSQAKRGPAAFAVDALPAGPG